MTANIPPPLPRFEDDAHEPRVVTQIRGSTTTHSFPPIEECTAEDLMRIAAGPLWMLMSSGSHVGGICVLLGMLHQQIGALQSQLAVEQGISTAYQHALERERQGAIHESQRVVAELERSTQLQQLLAERDAENAELRRLLVATAPTAITHQLTARFERLVVTVTGHRLAEVAAELERQAGDDTVVISPEDWADETPTPKEDQLTMAELVEERR